MEICTVADLVRAVLSGGSVVAFQLSLQATELFTIIALYFESENVLKLYNLEACAVIYRSLMTPVCSISGLIFFFSLLMLLFLC